MAKKKPQRGKPKDTGRRTKKKVSVLTTEKIDYVDYKDVNLIKKFISDRAKVRARRVTGNDTQQQAEIARAIKNAREMALIPYATRVTTQRGGRGDRGRRDFDGGGRSDSRRGPETEADTSAGSDASVEAAAPAPPAEPPAPVETASEEV